MYTASILRNVLEKAMLILDLCIDLSGERLKVLVGRKDAVANSGYSRYIQFFTDVRTIGSEHTSDLEHFQSQQEHSSNSDVLQQSPNLPKFRYTV